MTSELTPASLIAAMASRAVAIESMVLTAPVMTSLTLMWGSSFMALRPL